MSYVIPIMHVFIYSVEHLLLKHFQKIFYAPEKKNEKVWFQVKDYIILLFGDYTFKIEFTKKLLNRLPRYIDERRVCLKAGHPTMDGLR